MIKDSSLDGSSSSSPMDSVTTTGQTISNWLSDMEEIRNTEKEISDTSDTVWVLISLTYYAGFDWDGVDFFHSS